MGNREVGQQTSTQSQPVLVERGMVASPPPPARPVAIVTPAPSSSASTVQAQSNTVSQPAQVDCLYRNWIAHRDPDGS